MRPFPSWQILLPRPKALFSNRQTIEVIFSEPVTNVDAADLLINGVPVATVTQISPLDYTFAFPQPSEGTVTVAWATNHRIADLASIPNSFAGGEWTYTLNSNLPPAVVVISEFMADNDNGIKDDDGSRSDWIELSNYGSSSALLDGWFLTDSTNNPTKWRIPAVRIAAKSYLLLWASGKDRTTPSLRSTPTSSSTKKEATSHSWTRTPMSYQSLLRPFHLNALMFPMVEISSIPPSPDILFFPPQVTKTQVADRVSHLSRFSHKRRASSPTPQFPSTWRRRAGKFALPRMEARRAPTRPSTRVRLRSQRQPRLRRGFSAPVCCRAQSSRKIL